MNVKLILASEFSLKEEFASNIVDLIAEGNTIPFIARYRKEMHGGCDDQVLRDFSDRLTYLNNLIKRKDEVRSSIESQGKWSDELASALDAAMTQTEVEDIYRPYKQKKKTRASVAIAKGLEPLADIIMAQELASGDISELAMPFVDTDKEVASPDEAIAGALDIIAERISDDADTRKRLRQLLFDCAIIKSVFDPKQEDEAKKSVYEMYKEYSEKVDKIPSHRILAINRGENDECLKVSIEIEEELPLGTIATIFKKDSIFNSMMDATIKDSWQRLIYPSVEREVRGELTDTANEQAIKMFEVNLRPLLMQPPLKGKTILGFDPGYRTGCKVAVIDSSGNVLGHTVVYPTTKSENMIARAKDEITMLVKKHKVDVISIGNGTASKESEIFISELIKERSLDCKYIVVNEAGASVYSASKLGSEEFPEYDVTTRSAVSIARRLQDPLAELIKIDVKSIGVGQYQHDMPQKRLTEVLTGVVESCVNNVGVDLNTASYSLLSYVSGLNMSIAKNIVQRRKEKAYAHRRELLEVSKLGPKAFQQCAGFLRIPGSDEPLDNTAVHPESYDAAKKLLAIFGYTESDVVAGGVGELESQVKERGYAKTAQEIGVGEPTLRDIIEELTKPGRDIRDDLPPPVLRADLMDINDLKEGMELSGTVRNVIDFGVFVDIGVHQDGLVHISEISNNFIKHPSEALKVGQQVNVKVIGVDSQKNRISLSIKQAAGAEPRTAPPRREREDNHQPRREAEGVKPRREGEHSKSQMDRFSSKRESGNAQGRLLNSQRSGNQSRANEGAQRREGTNNNNNASSLEDMLKQLQNKYSKK